MRILVGLIEHMGDIVACEPVARYLKFNHPHAHLAWAVSPSYRELIDTNPYIDETITLDCLTDWIKLSNHHSFDKIVDLHVNYRICDHCQVPLVKRTGNPFVNVYEWFDHGAILEAFSIGAGLPGLSAQPHLHLGSEHAGAVDALDLPDTFCVIHRTSNSTEKDWTNSAWQDVATFIRSALGLRIIEVGSGTPSELPPPIDGSVTLVNRLPILQSAEVIRRARVFVGIDSGPAHLANALQTPGVILLGRIGFFRNYIPFTGFYARSSPSVRIVRNLVGPVRDLTVEEVTEAVRYVVSTGELSSPPHIAPSTTDHTARRRRLGLLSREPTAARSTAILASGLFDVGWYVSHYPEASETELHPIDHYLTCGAAKGYNPGPKFDGNWYLQANSDVASKGVNPLVHYYLYGKAQGRVSRALVREPDGSAWIDAAKTPGSADTAPSLWAIPGEVSAPVRLKDKVASNDVPRTFAFYLPQYHPIGENNWAHGMGFTEWHNVIRAKPLFRGHYQPRIPGELGFYDLRAEDVLRQQIKLAKEHGISGFCFYYYYFHGRKLLYQPIANFVRSNIDMPFMMLWANENWSKRWDGGDQDVIIAQQHSREDDLAFLLELIPLFRDTRYVKVDGKPILLVYKTHVFPDIRGTVEIWRENIEKHGFPGVFLVMVDDWTPEPDHPRQFGFDASYEIPSNLVPQPVLITEADYLDLQDGFEGKIVDYAKFASFHLSRPFPPYKRFRTVMLPWDNTPRYGSRAIVHINGQGDAYKLWLLQAILDTHRRYPPEERIVFIHSWNEWCEGTYLEPDARFERLFLEQTRDAIKIAREVIERAGGLASTNAMADLLRLQQMKDVGAFRVMEATRMQTVHVWGKLSQQHSEVLRLRDEVRRVSDDLRKATALAEAIRGSASWRLTKPIRTAAALLRKR